MRKLIIQMLLGIAMVSAWPAYAGKTLDQVRARGQLVCGVSTGTAGFSQTNSIGTGWSGLDVDVCRAIAAAVLGDSDKVIWVRLNPQERFTALQTGRVDILSRNTTWTLTRDASMGLRFVGVTFYDGQAFMVSSKGSIKNAKQLTGARVCVQSGTTTEKNLADFSRSNGLDIKPVLFEKSDSAVGAYFSGKCDALTDDSSALAAGRATASVNPADHMILPELISKEPLGPAILAGDDDWFAITKWIIFGLVEAEENGITRANVDALTKKSRDPSVMRILGTSEDTGKLLGLDKEWMRRATRAVGNYGEIFERNLGSKTPINLPRGANRLWSAGGIMYAPPIR
jgi:general L-amino acid transport system substrate-binding protein